MAKVTDKGHSMTSIARRLGVSTRLLYDDVRKVWHQMKRARPTAIRAKSGHVLASFYVAFVIDV